MLDLRGIHSAVKREDWATAWKLSNMALNVEPESPEALYLSGCVLRAMGNIGLASVTLSKAIAKERKQPNLWMTYAATLHDLNRWSDAEQAFTHVHKMLPHDPMPVANIAATYVQRGMWRDAANWADKALAIEPDNHIARISKGFACLSLGRWNEAWKYAEALYGHHLPRRVYGTEQPWDGTPGQTVVVQCDQGVGDIIMFAQCLPRLQADCKHVIVECAERMAGLFRRCFPGITVYGSLKDAAVSWLDDHQIDAAVHISYLGRWYLNRDADFERRAYIKPDMARVEKWLAWLEQFPRPWRGIAWQGGIQQTQTHLRSVTLEQYAPMLDKPGTAIDLSYHDSAREVAKWNIAHERQVIVPRVDKNDFDDTIALIAALDDVVTVTTTAAHVCGALGRKARVLVPAVAQWRYALHHGKDGSEMIWYPADSVRLFRQKPGETDWSAAINRLCGDIK